MKFATFVILIFLPVLTFADTRHETRYFELSATGIDTLVVDCQAGLLEVKGVAGHNRINVVAEIKLENITKSNHRKFLENNILLSLEKLRNKAILRSKIRDPSLAGDQTRIDLTLKVPKKINLKVTDGSGSINIRNIFGNLEIDDDTGSIKSAFTCPQLR